MLAVLCLSRALADAPPAADPAALRSALALELERHSQALTAPMAPPQREAALIAQRQATAEGYGQLCALEHQPGDCGAALAARADLEQAQVQPTQELPCAAAAAPATTLLGCLDAAVGRGVLVTTRYRPEFTVFVPEGAGTKVVSGTFDGARLRVEPVALQRDPGLAAAAAALTALPERIVLLEAPVDVITASGGRLVPFRDGWLVDTSPLAASDRVYCSTPGGLVPRARAPGREIIDEEVYSGRLWTAFAQPMPCREGWVFGAELGAAAGTRAQHPTTSTDPDVPPGPPFVQDGDGQSRTWTFGAATLVQRIPAGSYPPYRGQCTFTHAGGSMQVRSSYGCTVVLAAELNADTIADFVIHTGHESCEEDTLWMSGPTGWTEVASRGGCE